MVVVVAVAVHGLSRYGLKSEPRSTQVIPHLVRAVHPWLASRENGVRGHFNSQKLLCSRLWNKPIEY